MDSDGVTIRPPAVAELPGLRDIERAAGRAFAEIGLDDVAAHEPPSVEALAEALAAGHLLVGADGGAPVAYIWTEVLDGRLHVEQVSVHPDAGGRGIGRRLLDHVAGRDGVTLTTFRDVPWNAPYYRRLGFRDLAPDELGPELRARLADEAARGLDPATRVAMLR